MLITLQQVGSVEYTKWILVVPCSTKRKVIDDLQKQAKAMEDELNSWRMMVKNIRNDFYELNYYTTFQLLTLRKELGKVKNEVVNSEVLTLLHSISFQVTASIISDTLCNLSSEAIEYDESCPNEDEITEHVDIAETKPSVNDAELSVEKRKILADIVRMLNCPEWIVLKAFEENPGKEYSMQHYRTWCVYNMNRLNEEHEKDTDEGDYADEEDSSDESSISSSDPETETDHEGNKSSTAGTYT